MIFAEKKKKKKAVYFTKDNQIQKINTWSLRIAVGFTFAHIWALSWENRIFVYVKTKTQISFAGTVKLISAFVFAA